MFTFSKFFHALHELVSDGEGRAESEALALVAKVEVEAKSMIAESVGPLAEALADVRARIAELELKVSGKTAAPPAAPPQAVA